MANEEDPPEAEKMSMLSNRLIELRERKINTDLIINIGAREFHLHRLVLIAGSDYFSTMFNGEFSEKGNFRISLSEHNPTIFEKVIDLIYGVLPKFDSKLQNYQTVRLAHYFQVTTFDLNSLIENIICSGELEKSAVMEYIKTLSEICGDQIPKEHLSSLDTLVEPSWEELIQLTDEELMKFLDHCHDFIPWNIIDFHKKLVGLVNQGRTVRLLECVNPHCLPKEYRDSLSPEHRPENGAKNIPHLYKFQLEERECWQIIIAGPAKFEVNGKVKVPVITHQGAAIWEITLATARDIDCLSKIFALGRCNGAWISPDGRITI